MEDPKVHPAANIFPMMDDEAFERLKADIEKNGQRESVVYYQNQLLDGRNRVRACKELGIECEEEELDEDQDPIAFVLSSNLHRRQLTSSQKAMCAARVATLSNGRPGKNSANWRSLSADDASKLFGVGTRSIERARKVIRDGCKELISFCEAGRSVAKAIEIIDVCDDKRDQSMVCKGGWNLAMMQLKARRLPIRDNDTGHNDYSTHKFNPTLGQFIDRTAAEIETGVDVVSKIPADAWQYEDQETLQRLGTSCRKLAALIPTPEGEYPGERFGLAETAEEQDVAEVESWLERQDERPLIERFETLLAYASDAEKESMLSQLSKAAK